jgi:hypothetical protein
LRGLTDADQALDGGEVLDGTEPPALAVMLCPQTATAQQDNLRRYLACGLGNNFAIVETIENAKRFGRSVKTSHGSRKVVAVHGFSQHIAYNGTPFVNFKAERLEDYALTRQTLIENLSSLAKGTRDMESTTPREFYYNGFDIRAIDRSKLSGGVQSVDLLFRDDDETVVTLYILNTPPEAPQFSTIDQYRELSDAFVQNYTACVAKNLKWRQHSAVADTV